MDPLEAHAMMILNNQTSTQTGSSSPQQRQQQNGGPPMQQQQSQTHPSHQQHQPTIIPAQQQQVQLPQQQQVQLPQQQQVQLPQQNNFQPWLPNLITMNVPSSVQVQSSSTTNPMNKQRTNANQMLDQGNNMHQLGLPSLHHQQQQQKTPPALGAVNTDLIQAIAATIVTAPNGQPMILNPTALSALFDNQNKVNLSNSLRGHHPCTGNNINVNVSVQQQPQPQQQVQPSPQANNDNNHGSNANMIYADVLDVMGLQAQMGIDSSMTNNPGALSQQHQLLQQHHPGTNSIETSRKRNIDLNENNNNHQFPPNKKLVIGTDNRSINNVTSLDLPTSDIQFSTNHHTNERQQQQISQLDSSMSKSDILQHQDYDNSKKLVTLPDMTHMTPDERRRYERNLREQQRSHRISQQIKELRTLLTESKVPFKPNKYSILMSVAEYIKQLQTQSTFLDGEMNKLINTIQKSSELVNSGLTPSITSNEVLIGNDAELLYVKGLDYKSIFEQTSVASAISSLDGRILKCNPKFERLSGYPFIELEKQNLFNLLDRAEVESAYKALGKFLHNPAAAAARGGGDTSSGFSNLSSGTNYWSGKLINPNLQMNITVTRTSSGAPKFLNCTLSSVEPQAKVPCQNVQQGRRD